MQEKMASDQDHDDAGFPIIGLVGLLGFAALLLVISVRHFELAQGLIGFFELFRGQDLAL
jgi:hypothetical protein